MCVRSGGVVSSHAVDMGGSVLRLLLDAFLLAAVKIKRRLLASKRPRMLLQRMVDELL